MAESSYSRHLIEDGFAPTLEDFASARRFMDDVVAGRVDPEELVALIAKAQVRNDMRDRMHRPYKPQRLTMKADATIKRY